MNDYEITHAMIVYGGGFVSALGRLYRQADEVNQERLKKAFGDYWFEYGEIAAEMAKLKAEASS